MKKSKFLRSSKEMLSRSFNPSKCKTSLRLASSRLKLMRNKKEAQVKQTRREISLLLESGQDQTARMRVKHVIREEKLVTAFDLIGIYCELIVARLPIIESQKICPIDLKEAITSVVFASLRCSDIPELAEIKKHFTDKYGKDFITAAVELRPECGVSRMLIEKLSAVATDVQTKTKILTAIADEHNVKWDSTSFEENSAPANDLLSGPTSFVKESHSQRSDIKAPQNNQLHGSTLNSTQVSGYSTSFQHEEKLQALGGERAQLFRGDSNRERWILEFKDATSAAQAAAESAEIASFAARAAAELSSRGSITSQPSTESCYFDNRSLRDDAHDSYMRLKLGSEQFPRDSYSRKELSHSSSLKSKASNDDDDVPVVDRYSPKSSSIEVSRDEKRMQRRPFKYHNENRVEKAEDVGEEMTRKQERSTSFLDPGKIGTHEDTDASAVVFDRYDSDTEDYGFNRSPTYDEPQQGLELPLSSRKKDEYFSWSTESSSSKTAKSTASAVQTRRSSSSDSPKRSMDGSKLKQSVGSQFKHESRSPYKGSPQHYQTELSLSSDYESEETDSERNQGEKFDVDPPPRFRLAKSSPQQPTFSPKKNRTELVDSSPERGEGLLNNFGKLTGGFRHKGHDYPFLGKNQFDSFPSNKESKANVMLERKNTKPELQPTSDTDSSEEEEEEEEEEEDSLMRRSDNKHQLQLNTKPSFAASNPKFGSENSDLNADLPKESLRRTSGLLSGISRRTKAFPPNQEKEKYSELKIRSEALDPDKATTSTGSGTPKQYEIKRNSSKLENYKKHTFNSEAATSLRTQVSKVEIRSEANNSHARMERKPTESYSAEPQQHLPFLKGNSKLSSSSKVATKPTDSYLRESLYRDSSEKAESRTVQESKLSAKSCAIEDASLPQNTAEPNLKTEKATHVHPKLPDYDSLIQFFQKNRT